MADEPAPSEEPTGTPIVPADIPEIGNEVTFIEPKTITEMGQTVDHGDEPETPEAPEVPEIPVAPEVPAPQVPVVQDPGAFTPQDYSFEVSIKGKAQKVSSVEEADALAADPDNFETPQQLMEFIRKSNKMENGIEKDKQAWEQSKTEFDAQQTADTARQEQINTLAAELTYLEQRGDLPPIAKEYQNVPNWNDPLIAGQPGIRERIALISYMKEENGRREKAGLKSNASALDAFNGWKIEEAKVKADKDNKTASEQRKANGAKVASSSPAPLTSRPKGIAVGRVGNLNNLASGWNQSQ